MHPKSAENLGFVLALDDGSRIYHAGDTHFVPEMRQLSNIDLALLPIGGNNFTMGPEEAAEFANHLKPQTVIPMHFPMRKKGSMDDFQELLAEGIKVQRML